MKRIVLCMIFIMCLSGHAMAGDSMEPVFTGIDDLIVRIDSGISLNSFAETFAAMKLEYKKAQKDATLPDNPLLSDKMKTIIVTLDDYAKVWKGQEVDGYKYVPQGTPLLGRYETDNCRVSLRDGTRAYEIPCVKTTILNELRTSAEKAKSAHFNGW